MRGVTARLATGPSIRRRSAHSPSAHREFPTWSDPQGHGTAPQPAPNVLPYFLSYPLQYITSIKIDMSSAAIYMYCSPHPTLLRCTAGVFAATLNRASRSEERRVGKECR